LTVQQENDPPDRFLICFTLFDGSVHPLHLAVCRENSPPDCFLILQTPRVIGLCQPVLDAVSVTDHVEAHGAGTDLVPVAGLISELDTLRHGYSNHVWMAPA